MGKFKQTVYNNDDDVDDDAKDDDTFTNTCTYTSL